MCDKESRAFELHVKDYAEFVRPFVSDIYQTIAYWPPGHVDPCRIKVPSGCLYQIC